MWPEKRQPVAMANVLGAFGFAHRGTASGPVNFAESHNPPYRIAAGYTTAIFFGDAVRMNSAGPTGFIEQWAAGDGSAAAKILVGIFIGCSYFSTSQQKQVFNRYWPGSDATGDVDAFVVDDPNAQFLVQSNGSSSPITQVSIGQTADIVSGSGSNGSTVTGISGMTLDNPTTSAVLPFKVVNVVKDPPGANGADLTTAFNYVIVAFNNQQYKSLVGV
jgi:hypothetical protein